MDPASTDLDEKAEAVEQAVEALEAAESEALETAIEETATVAVAAELTAETAVCVAHDAHDRIDDTERELQHHEETDQWLRKEVETLKAEVSEMRSMLSTKKSESELSSIPDSSSVDLPPEVLTAEVTTNPEPVEPDSIKTEASPESAGESPEAKPARKRHRLV